MLKKTVLVAVIAIGSALGVAAPANAGPLENPCPLAVSFLCAFVGSMPELDHDVDLTEGASTSADEPIPQVTGVPDLLYGPPADVCAKGCI